MNPTRTLVALGLTFTVLISGLGAPASADGPLPPDVPPTRPLTEPLCDPLGGSDLESPCRGTVNTVNLVADVIAGRVEDECNYSAAPPAPATAAPVPVEVLVLLDGVDADTAAAILDQASIPYEEIGIELRADYQTMPLPDGDELDLLRQARAALGGAVPESHDMVHVLSDNEGMGTQGVALCIGGVKHPTLAFSMAKPGLTEPEVPSNPLALPGWLYYLNDDAILTAHEIGHVLGARHEQSNCVEGLLATIDPQPCTTMWPGEPVMPKALRFSTVNAATIVAHAAAWAG